MELHLLELIGLLLVPALLAAFAADLLKAAIALLVCSVGLTVLLFNLGAPLVAVFELSVCAGLITVLFVNAISLTNPFSDQERRERAKGHYRRFALMWLVVVGVAVVLWFNRDLVASLFPVTKVTERFTTGEILWKQRTLDLIGQMAIILVGVYGVVVLFKRGKDNV